MSLYVGRLSHSVMPQAGLMISSMTRICSYSKVVVMCSVLLALQACSGQ